VLISFDPNLRFNLWNSREALKEAVLEFIPLADILKVSDEELSFITGIEDEDKAINSLFQGNVKLVVYTKGAEGAFAYTKKTSAFSEGVKVNAVDTTGAGDAFIGSFLYSLYERNISDVTELSEKEMREMLSFSNRYCAKSVMKNGAIESYPTLEEMNL
jgi:fructokinase